MKFAMSDLRLSSPAFETGGSIPAKHTGEGEDTSPPLEWSAVPEGTRSFALICHDPDAPVVSSGGYGFVHWVLYNINTAQFSYVLLCAQAGFRCCTGRVTLTLSLKRPFCASFDRLIRYNGCGLSRAH